MSLLAVIELLLLVHMVLFLAAFSLLAQPEPLIQAILSRIRGDAYEALEHRERAEALLRKTLWYLGGALAVMLLGWSFLTGFVVTLYRTGFFWRF